MGAQASQIAGAQCRPCKGDLPCKGDGFAEFLEDDPAALEGDVKNSQAMTNHKLLKAARDGSVDSIVKMLGRGAYIETRRPFVMTPESVTTTDSSLLTRGVGLTPLMYAAQGGYDDACEILLKAGACVNAEDEDGMRPLHFAASSGCIETCQVVLAAGAEADAHDDEGRTALDLIPPGDCVTQAEKRNWQDLLGQAETSLDGDSVTRAGKRSWQNPAGHAEASPGGPDASSETDTKRAANELADLVSVDTDTKSDANELADLVSMDVAE